MYTKAQLLQAIPEVPAEFSLAELEEILRRPRPALTPPPRPANLTPEQAAEWDYYTSPEAMKLVNRFPPLPPKLAALRGIAGGLSDEDKRKSAKDWEAERIQEKYGL